MSSSPPPSNLGRRGLRNAAIMSVVMVALIAALFLGEKLSPLNWVGVALIGVGAILVAVQV